VAGPLITLLLMFASASYLENLRRAIVKRKLSIGDVWWVGVFIGPIPALLTYGGMIGMPLVSNLWLAATLHSKISIITMPAVTVTSMFLFAKVLSMRGLSR